MDTARAPRSPLALSFLLASLALASCGGGGTPDGGAGGPLSGEGPYLTSSTGQVRTIVLTSEERRYPKRFLPSTTWR